MPQVLLPIPPDDPHELAEVWTQWHDQLDQFAASWRAAKSRLQQWVRDTGPQRIGKQRLTIAPAGYDWSAEAIDRVAEKYPALISAATVTVTFAGDTEGIPAMDRARAVAEMAMEYDPTASIEWDKTIDKRECNEMIREGGEVGEFLRTLRETRGRLVVKAQR